MNVGRKHAEGSRVGEVVGLELAFRCAVAPEIVCAGGMPSRVS